MTRNEFAEVALVLVGGAIALTCFHGILSSCRDEEEAAKDFRAHPVFCVLNDPPRCIAVRSDSTTVSQGSEGLIVERAGKEIFRYVGRFTCSSIAENIGNNASACTTVRTTEDEASTKDGAP